MNFEFIKKVARKSAILGAIIGLITLIPYINLFSFLFLAFLAAPYVVIKMKQKNQIGILDTQESAIWGAIIGISAFSGFFAVFTPLCGLIGLIFKADIYLSFKVMWSSGGGIMTLIMSYIMIGLIIALFNAFSAAIAEYLYQQIKNLTKEKNETFKIDNRG